MVFRFSQLLTEIEYQEYFLGGKDRWRVGLTILPLSCIECLEIWELQAPGTSGPVQACNGVVLLLPLTYYIDYRYEGRTESYKQQFFVK
jgi:hypothetical protein